MRAKINFGILLATKNSYSMLSEWYSLFDYKDIPILNIDLNSNSEFQKIGRDFCNDNQINFVQCLDTTIQSNIAQGLNFFKKKYNIDWLLYMHHDAFPMEKKTLIKLSNIIKKSKKIKNYGVIGFNIYHDKFELNKFSPKQKRLMTTARTPLELGNGYYNSRIESRANYAKFLIKPFAVESVFWSTALINYDQFNNFIKIDKNFNFFHSWDDIAFQFMAKNIYNIVIPELCFGHDQSLKLNHKLPFSSPDKKSRNRYGRFDHLKVWEEKWRFKYSFSKIAFGGDFFVNKNGFINKLIFTVSNLFKIDFSSNLQTVARYSYLKNNNKKAKIFEEFYNHDPKLGPLKYLDL